MRKSILIFVLSVLLIPLTLNSCKDQKRNTGNEPDGTETPRNNMENRGTETRPADERNMNNDQDASERHGNAMDKVEEKADRVVGDYEDALKKARDRVKNADEKIERATREGKDDEVQEARKDKQKAEKEIKDLEQKIRNKNRND